ncbi:hypothetical protein GL218_00184 [Daldinia childiae]|uniref:uncharacterized protein n=1 Tax=Daldinia childiae TaxID=326645 RepID=UPI001445206F|nr:uncharacterized protein GL218_00184 [Daldinia childiae]KAF3070845.1 hypothetical protein GL218_00184 [Daldinia childiae]
MQLTAASLFLASLLASNAAAVPLTTRQASSVEGQACTDGRFDGTCRADGRCGLNLPPNELSFQFVSGQCGVADSTGGAFDDFFGRKNNGVDDDAATDDGTDDGIDDDSVAGDSDDGLDSDTDDEDNGNQASVEGQACTDGQFDGFCRADGRCGLQLPPNELSFQFVSGQCGK